MLTTDHFILTCFDHGYKVRVSTLYHVLVGKRTGSVLVYAFFYHQMRYFGLLPNLNRDVYDDVLARLVANEFLLQDETTVQLTLKGQRELTRLRALPTENICSHRYLKIDDEFLDLLLFATQVISHLAYVEKDYTPIEVRVDKQRFIRSWLQVQTSDRYVLAEAFYQEWFSLLTKLPLEEATYWTKRLSGHEKIGRTSHQLLTESTTDAFAVFLCEKNYQHHLLSVLEQDIVHLPMMRSLIKGLTHHPYNQSMLETVEVIKEKGTLEAVQTIRRLKYSTVVDHLIEWAIYDEHYQTWFSLAPETTAKLKVYEKQHPMIRDWRFKDVQAVLPEIEFYEMRLFQINEIRVEGRR
ncbi:helix-turn-helix domain-containing protein [Vagococcus lutrae]|uniref:helix-turn-helix domain-containing protein n=2 Tax=Vagococcus lutrae TaxID=81947 RepID=UPI00200CD4C5|nr:helix-turn-helix domain-containing protein [Vagococcus lutrae]UQF38739.1 helix-turn-helix domain-containing protein [Vagococcus lutrae]UQF64511.1 helix-turn-helix domain-containing protein [Vagococcus lutrae]